MADQSPEPPPGAAHRNVSQERPVLRFTDIRQASPGSLSALLQQAYADLLRADGPFGRRESAKWDEFDRIAFSSAQVARCVFVSWFGGSVVGFGSFDPRGAPRDARIGHHCIAPGFQGRGFGGLQLQEILRRLRPFGALQIHAFTLGLPFFAPARRIYTSAGFEIVARTPWEEDAGVEKLHFLKRG